MIELLISLIVISLILAALMPLISKKTKGTTAIIGNSSDITTECDAFGEYCELCTKNYCINCTLSSCTSGQYVYSKTCECKSCSEKFNNCATCTSEKCTGCDTSDGQSRYLNSDNLCENCPSGKCCDGTNIQDTGTSSGYFCDDNNIAKKCTDKYSNYCTTCDKSKCLSCESYYRLDTSNASNSNSCERCSAAACATCTESASKCTQCQGDWVYYSYSCYGGCPGVISNCVNCRPNYPGDSTSSVCTNKYSAYCTKCFAGYYLGANGCTCEKCPDIEGCLYCSTSTTCATCESGYYLNGSTCKSCTGYDSNCTICDSSSCLSCAQGYHLSDDKTSCESDNSTFNCSDSNFIKIGDLCVTRKNMGDSSVLTIPSSIIIATAGSDYCYSSSNKCCWQGTTTTNSCNSNYGGYSGCTRTVCNWEAANEICSNFSYGGLNWRLPTLDETANWGSYSIGLGSNGLMLCDPYGKYAPQCYQGNVCYGVPSESSTCNIWSIWLYNRYNSNLYAYTRYQNNATYGYSSGKISAALSVRCVADME